MCSNCYKDFLVETAKGETKRKGGRYVISLVVGGDYVDIHIVFLCAHLSITQMTWENNPCLRFTVG